MEDGVHTYLSAKERRNVSSNFLLVFKKTCTPKGIFGKKVQSEINTAAAMTVVQSPDLSPCADWQIWVVLMIFPLAL